MVITHSNCVEATQLRIDRHVMTLVSSHAPSKQAHKLSNLQPLILPPTTRTTHLLVEMDCNLHHALWKPASYFHAHCQADNLILTMSEAGLNLLSECGTPNSYPSNPNHATTTVNMTWILPTLFDWTTYCQTDVDHTHSRLSDCQPHQSYHSPCHDSYL